MAEKKPSKLFTHIRNNTLTREALADVCETEDINQRTKRGGETAVIFAVKHGRFDLVRLLIEEGKADPHRLDRRGRSAFMWACREGLLPIVQYFVEGVGARIGESDRHGKTGLQLAAHNGHASTVRYLIYECIVPTSKLLAEARCWGRSYPYVIEPIKLAQGEVRGIWNINYYHDREKQERKKQRIQILPTGIRVIKKGLLTKTHEHTFPWNQWSSVQLNGNQLWIDINESSTIEMELKAASSMKETLDRLICKMFPSYVARLWMEDYITKGRLHFKKVRGKESDDENIDQMKHDIAKLEKLEQNDVATGNYDSAHNKKLEREMLQSKLSDLLAKSGGDAKSGPEGDISALKKRFEGFKQWLIDESQFLEKRESEHKSRGQYQLATGAKAARDGLFQHIAIVDNYATQVQYLYECVSKGDARGFEAAALERQGVRLSRSRSADAREGTFDYYPYLGTSSLHTTQPTAPPSPRSVLPMSPAFIQPLVYGGTYPQMYGGYAYMVLDDAALEGGSLEEVPYGFNRTPSLFRGVDGEHPRPVLKGARDVGLEPDPEAGSGPARAFRRRRYQSPVDASPPALPYDASPASPASAVSPESEDQEDQEDQEDEREMKNERRERALPSHHQGQQEKQEKQEREFRAKDRAREAPAVSSAEEREIVKGKDKDFRAKDKESTHQGGRKHSEDIVFV
jgi:hypothetical protein